MKRVISILFLLFSFGSNHACDCVTPLRGLSKSDAVFKGEVLSIKLADSIFMYEVTFKVDTVIKGQIGSKTAKVFIPDDNCGIFMRVQDKFIVYAYNEHMEYNSGIRLCTDVCSETHKLP